MSPKRQRRHRTSLVHARPKKLDDVRSEINVTPLVDVCLVLLIIFMVVLPMLTRGKEVPLPQSRHHEDKEDVGARPIVSVVSDRGEAKIYYDRELVSDMEVLKTKVRDGLKHMSKDVDVKAVFLKADKDIPFSKVYPVLIALKEAGSEGVDLGTNAVKE